MSWTSEARQAQGTIGGANLPVVLVASVVVAVVVPLAGYELIDHLIRSTGPSSLDLRNVFLLIAAMAMIGTATAVFAAFATRLPFAGVGVAVASSVLLLVYELLRGRTFDGVGDEILWSVLLTSLCLLGADLLVLARRGLPLGLELALAGALAVVAATVVVQLVSYPVHGLPLSVVLQSWRLLLQLVVELPVILVAGGLLGWWVNRLLSPPARPPGAAG